MAKASEWIPEFDRDAWLVRRKQSEHFCSLLAISHKVDGEPKSISDWVEESLTEEEATNALESLAGDIGNVHLDGLFYYNGLESTKNDGTDEAATNLWRRMDELGMTSTLLPPESEGGPGVPRPHSLVPWRRMLQWLLWQLADVGLWLAKQVGPLMALIRKSSELQGGLISISLSVGLPPALVFGFDPKVNIQGNAASLIKNIYRHTREVKVVA